MSTVVVLLFACEHRHKLCTRTSTVYKYVKEHYLISKEHCGLVSTRLRTPDIDLQSFASLESFLPPILCYVEYHKDLPWGLSYSMFCCCCCCSCRWGDTVCLNCGHQRVYCLSPRWYMSMESWVKWYWQRKTKDLREKPVLVPLIEAGMCYIDEFPGNSPSVCPLIQLQTSILMPTNRLNFMYLLWISCHWTLLCWMSLLNGKHCWVKYFVLLLSMSRQMLG
jgi:hypothetical protein